MAPRTSAGHWPPSRRARPSCAYLELRLLADAEETGATADASAGSAADWLAVEARQVRRDARSDLKLATKLEHHDLLSAGMAAGQVNPAQARAIVAALERLPRTR